MNLFFYFACFLSSGYFLFRLIELIQKRNESKFKTDIAHFLSDLYKLKIKWADRGQFGYVDSIDNLIKFHGNIETKPKDGGVGLPITNDALSTEIQLKNQRRDELKEFLGEFEQSLK